MALTKGEAYTLRVPFPDTGLTITPTVSKDGGAFNAAANACTEIGSTKVYTITLSTTEMTVDDALDVLLTPNTGDAILVNLVTDPTGLATASALTTVGDNVTSIKGTVEHATYGLSALHNVLTVAGVMFDDAEAAALAALIESYLVNETDATALMQAIVDKFAASYPDLDDVTTAALAAAVWASATRTLTALPSGCATEAKQDTAKTVIDTIAADVVNIDGASITTPPTADAIGTATASKILATPANKLATDASGKVTVGNPDDCKADLTGIATTTDVTDAAAEIIAAVDGEVDDGVTITQASLGTDGEALGRVQPNAKVTVYLGGEPQYQFDADADGDFSYNLPAGSTWQLRAVAPRYVDIVLEVTT